MRRSKAEIVGRMVEVIEEVSIGNIPASSVRETDRILIELGLDSMDYASVLLQCEQWLHIKVKEDQVDWREIQTVGQLATFLEGQQP
jgi:acyl carrier protein